MTERQYTASEIADLRQVCDYKYLFGTFTMMGGSGASRCYQEQDKAVAVEQMVRTYVLAGLTAADLRASERGFASGMEARQGRDAAERLDGEAATARPDAQEQPLEPKD